MTNPKKEFNQIRRQVRMRNRARGKLAYLLLATMIRRGLQQPWIRWISNGNYQNELHEEIIADYFEVSQYYFKVDYTYFSTIAPNKADAINLGPKLTAYTPPVTNQEKECMSLLDQHWYFIGLVFKYVGRDEDASSIAKSGYVILNREQNVSPCSTEELSKRDYLSLNYITPSREYKNYYDPFKRNSGKFRFELRRVKYARGLTFRFNYPIEYFEGSDLSFLSGSFRNQIVIKTDMTLSVEYNDPYFFSSNDFSHQEKMEGLTSNRYLGFHLSLKKKYRILQKEYESSSFEVKSYNYAMQLGAYEINQKILSQGKVLSIEYITQDDAKSSPISELVAEIRLVPPNLMIKYTGKFHDSGGDIPFSEELSYPYPTVEDYFNILISFAYEPDLSNTEDYINYRIYFQILNPQIEVKWFKTFNNILYPVFLKVKVFGEITIRSLETSGAEITNDPKVNLVESGYSFGFLDDQEFGDQVMLQAGLIDKLDNGCYFYYGNYGSRFGRCGFCSSLVSKTGDDLKFTNSTSYCDSTYQPTIANCKQMKSGSCATCDESFSKSYDVDYNYQGTICIPPAERLNNIENFFFEKTYENGETQSFSYACPSSCKGCDANNICVGCHGEFQNPVGQKCVCEIERCSYCSNSPCSRCYYGYDLHSVDGEIKCLRKWNYVEPNGCHPGYGQDHEDDDSCKPCKQTGCPECSQDFNVCNYCNNGKKVIDWSLHPHQPNSTIECLQIFGQEVPYYFYNPETDIFERCDDNCLKCTKTRCEVCEENFRVSGSGACEFHCNAPMVVDGSNPNTCYDCAAGTEEVENNPLCAEFFKDFEFTMVEKETEDLKTYFKFEIKGIEEPQKPYKNNEEFQNFFLDHFNVELNIPKTSYYVSFEEPELAIEPIILLKKLEAKISVKNPVVINEDPSIPFIILKDKTVKLEFTPSTNKKLQVEAPPALEKTAESLETMGQVSSYSSTFMVIMMTLANFDVSDTLFKVIQVVIIFDKLRLLNLKMENRLGLFTEILSDMFNSSLMEKDDLQETLRSSGDMFYKLKLSPFAYRRKLDKMIILTIALILEVVRLVILRKVRKGDELTLTKMERRGKIVKLLGRLKLSLVLISAVEVFFYCGHQILHQKTSSIFDNFEHCFTYFWSLVLFLSSIYFFCELLRGAGNLSPKYIEKIKQEHTREEESKSLRREMKENGHDDSQIIGLKENSIDNDDQQKVRSLEINFLGTYKKLSTNEALDSFLLDNLNPKKIDKIPTYYNLAILIRLTFICAPLLVFQNSPFTQIMVFILTETLYLSFILYQQKENQVVTSKLQIVSTGLESFTLLNYGAFGLICYFGFGEGSNGVYNYETFVLVCFALTVFCQYFFLIFMLFVILGSFIFKKRGKVEPKKEDDQDVEELKVTKLEGFYINYWLEHPFICVEKIYEEDEILEVQNSLPERSNKRKKNKVREKKGKRKRSDRKERVKDEGHVLPDFPPLPFDDESRWKTIKTNKRKKDKSPAKRTKKKKNKLFSMNRDRPHKVKSRQIELGFVKAKDSEAAQDHIEGENRRNKDIKKRKKRRRG